MKHDSHAYCPQPSSPDTCIEVPNATLRPLQGLLLTGPLPFSVPCRNLQTSAPCLFLVPAGTYNRTPTAMFCNIQSTALTCPLPCPPLQAHIVTLTDTHGSAICYLPTSLLWLFHKCSHSNDCLSWTGICMNCMSTTHI